MLKPMFQTMFDENTRNLKRDLQPYDSKATIMFRGLSLNPNEAAAFPLLKPIVVKDFWYWCSDLARMHSDEVMLFLKKHSSHLNWTSLNNPIWGNPHPIAIQLIKEHLHCANWYQLSQNPSDEALAILQANFDKINWIQLSANTNDKAIELLKDNPRKINWKQLSTNPNPNAVKLLKEYRRKIKWDYLCSNTNDEALTMLIECYHKPNKTNHEQNLLVKEAWSCCNFLSRNPNPLAIQLLAQMPQLKPNWHWLASNPCDEAVDIVLNYIESNSSIDYSTLEHITVGLQRNPNPRAFEYVLSNPNLFPLEQLSHIWCNPNIFEPEEEFIFK